VTAPDQTSAAAAGSRRHGTAEPQLRISHSRHLAAWLAQQDVSIAFTTYQAGKLFLIGRNPRGRLSVFERTFHRCMGLCVTATGLWMSSLYQLWRFENALVPGQARDGFDRLYVPQVGYTTGDVDIHDIAVDDAGGVVFVNTLFSCLARPSESESFVPVWRPPFITKLAAEDRCHLNGLAMDGHRPRFVTVASRSDVAAGWRDRRASGGCVIDVASGEVIAAGLSMPHSPRWYRGRLWLLNSGTGHFGFVDLAHGRFEPLAFCPGYLRGLAFSGGFALVGLSKCRANRTFSGLELDQNLTARDAKARCGLMVIDLRSLDIVHWLAIEGVVEELYDVAIVPQAVRPMAVGFKTDEICRTITIGDPTA
jgi:uncharacterized protein (TIGR03032 family)